MPNNLPDLTLRQAKVQRHSGVCMNYANEESQGKPANKISISPSILSADLSRIGSVLESLESSGADSVHIDVMDGHFVNNIAFGPAFVKSMRRHTALPFKVHLMIEKPAAYAPQFISAGSDLLIFHRETVSDVAGTIDQIESHGAKAGIALNPETQISEAAEFIPRISSLLIMSVNPGFAGQKFIPTVLPKITEARRLISEKGLRTGVAVDGGINSATARDAIRSGADELIAATYVFGSENIADAISNLRNS